MEGTRHPPIIVAPARDLDEEELRAVALRVAADRESWAPSLPSDLSGRPYVPIHSSEHLGVWAIGWGEEDDDTGFHDHDHSSGAVAVACGAIANEGLRIDGEVSCELVAEGGVFTFDGCAIHRMRYDRRGGPSVTIHVYSPPLEWTGEYTAAEPHKPLRRVRTPSNEPLAPKHGGGR